MCKFSLHAKSKQLSLIFWQHFWGQAWSCLPCHLPYTSMLVHCTYQIKVYQIGSKILEIPSNFTPCKSNGSEFSCFLSLHLHLCWYSLTAFQQLNEDLCVVSQLADTCARCSYIQFVRVKSQLLWFRQWWLPWTAPLWAAQWCWWGAHPSPSESLERSSVCSCRN